MRSHVYTLAAVVITLALPATASAQEAAVTPADCAGFDLARFKSLVDQGRAAVWSEGSATTVDEVHQQLQAQVPCLEEVVPPEVWAIHLVDLSILAYERNEDWQSPLAAALTAWPTVDRVVGSDHPVGAFTLPRTDDSHARAVPPGGAVYLDGRWVSYLEKLRGPHLVQVERQGELMSWLVQGDGTGAAWQPAVAWLEQAVAASSTTTAPPEPEPRRSGTGWLVAGGVVGVVGTGLGVGTWAARDAVAGDPDQQGAMVAGNTVGWGLALVGGGLVGVGLVRSLDAQPRVRVGPGSLHLQGSFR